MEVLLKLLVKKQDLLVLEQTVIIYIKKLQYKEM